MSRGRPPPALSPGQWVSRLCFLTTRMSWGKDRRNSCWQSQEEALEGGLLPCPPPTESREEDEGLGQEPGAGGMPVTPPRASWPHWEEEGALDLKEREEGGRQVSSSSLKNKQSQIKKKCADTIRGAFWVCIVWVAASVLPQAAFPCWLGGFSALKAAYTHSPWLPTVRGTSQTAFLRHCPMPLSYVCRSWPPRSGAPCSLCTGPGVPHTDP